MIDYKKHFMGSYVPENFNKETNIIVNHRLLEIDKLNNDIDIQNQYKNLYKEILGFFTSDIIDYKEILFELFDSLVDIKLSSIQVEDLKKACSLEEDDLIKKGTQDRHINQHYMGRYKFFLRINCNYENFKLNVNNHSTQYIDDLIKHDQLKIGNTDYVDLMIKGPFKLQELFKEVLKNKYYSIDKELTSFLRDKGEEFAYKIIGNAIEIACRYQKYKDNKDDTHREREEKPGIVKEELRKSKNAEKIKKLQENSKAIKSIIFKTNEQYFEFKSKDITTIVLDELFNTCITRTYNSIEIDNDAKFAEKIENFVKQPDAHLFHSIAEVFLHYNLFTLKDQSKPITITKPNKKKSLNFVNSKNSRFALIFAIATNLVGPLYRLSNNHKDGKNAKLLIETNEYEKMSTFTKDRLKTEIMSLKFKL